MWYVNLSGEFVESKNKYMVVFVDSRSRLIVVYFNVKERGLGAQSIGEVHKQVFGTPEV